MVSWTHKVLYSLCVASLPSFVASFRVAEEHETLDAAGADLEVAWTWGSEGGSDHDLRVMSSDLERKADLHLPPHVTNAPRGSLIPLVVNLHAWGSSSQLQASMTGMNDLADREGFAVLYPQGYALANPLPGMPLGVGYSLNAGVCCPKGNSDKIDDVAFVRDAVDFTSRFLGNVTGGRVAVDVQRIYATGMSNGAFMANRLGCEAADLFAAIAPVSGPIGNGTSPEWGGDPYECPVPSQPMPTLHFHGSADSVVPWDGNDQVGFPSIDDYISLRRRLNGIPEDDAGKVTFQTPHVTCTGYGDHTANVTVCRQAGVGHSWPNAAGVGLCVPFGPFACTREIDATEQIWEFFLGFRKEGVEQLDIAIAAASDGIDRKLRLVSGGLQRMANLHLPPHINDAASGSLMPLVVNLHAWGSNSELQAMMTGMNSLADQEGFAVLYPQGYALANPLPWMPLGVGYSWNAGACCPKGSADKIDDVAFIRDAVAFASGFLANLTGGAVTVDVQRIYATGMSNGGFMTNRLGCEASDLFAAIAPVSGPIGNGTSPMWGSDPYECPVPSRPMPTLHFHGTGDIIVPWEGTRVLGFPSVDDYISLRRRLNGIPEDDVGTVTFESPRVTCTGYGGHAANVTVCRQALVGHSWPGSPGFGMCPLLGPFACTREIDATSQIWQFFLGYRMDSWS